MPSPASTKRESASSGRFWRPVRAAGGSTWATALRLLELTIAVDARGLALTLAVALAASLAEGLGLMLLLPLLAVAGMNFTGSYMAGRLASIAQRLLSMGGVPHGLWLPVVLGVFLGTGALRLMLRRSQSMMSFATTTKVQLAFSRRVYAAVVKAQWGFLVRQRAGRLTHMLTEELRQTGDAVSLLLSLINLGCLTLLYLAVAVKLSRAMTLLVLAMGVVLMLLQRRSMERMRKSGASLHASAGEVYAATDERLLNLKSVKAYNAEDRDVQLFGDLCDEVARHTKDVAWHQAVAAFRFEAGSLVALGAVVFLALAVLHVEAATMLLLLAIFTRLMPQLATMQGQTHQVASMLPAYDHVLAIEAECLANAEARAPDAIGGAAVEIVPVVLRREFRLESVWFAYATPERRRGADVRETEQEFVLRGIDLPIAAGMITAIVGPSGAGKSTIADLTNGLLLPTRGRLLLDGWPMDRGEFLQWRRQVGYVGQETVLFHKSVRENLLWARPDATEDDLREALMLASAGFVYELPGGLETIVGDRGILLSSGQRQRISLARAMLRRPTLLILDEATNALDVENEARILDSIREVIRSAKQVGRPALTVLMVAHRATAIERADCVFELENGRIARAGTWAQINAGTVR